MPKITTRDLVEKLNLEIVSGEKGLDREITTDELSRPALQLAGYFKILQNLWGIFQTILEKNLHLQLQFTVCS